MRSFHTLPAAFALSFSLPLGLAANGAFSSWEQLNHQTGAGSVAVQEYLAFDELDGFADATGYTVAIGAGSPETISRNPDYDDAFKRRVSYPTLGDMLAARPQGSSYTHTIGGGPLTGTSTIAAPDLPYASGIPANPVFTLSGVSGEWILTGGQATFYFDPAEVESFTVTLNPYAAATQGDLFVQAVFVSQIIGDGPSRVGSLESEPETYAGPVDPLSVTFTKDLAPGDVTVSHYGFAPGNFYELEAEFVNVFNLTDGFDGDPEADAYSAFVYQNVTTVVFAALPAPIPEPAAATALLGLVGLGLAATRRLR